MLRSCTRIQLLVEIEGSSYGEEWTVKELSEQSSKEALQVVKNRLAKESVVIIGEPKVILITTVSS